MNNKELDKDSFEQGVIFAIKSLRDLGDSVNHLSKWSHSRDLKFAPVELSDYILIQYKKSLGVKRTIKPIKQGILLREQR